MKRSLSTVALALLALPLLAASSLEPAFTVGGKVAKPLELSMAALAAMEHIDVSVKDHGGKDAVYRGVRLRTLLQQAGAPIGNNQMRGPNAVLYVVATAPDGYRVVYALAEFDAEISDREIILADLRDGAALNAQEGPLRIVVTGEKKPARWIRNVSGLRVETAATP